MKRHLVVLMALFVGLATPVVACDDMEDQAYLLDEILRLSYEGVPDRIIIKQMQTMDFVFCISADDIIELRGLGVSDEVIEAIIDDDVVAKQLREAALAEEDPELRGITEGGAIGDLGQQGHRRAELGLVIERDLGNLAGASALLRRAIGLEPEFLVLRVDRDGRPVARLTSAVGS